MELLKAFKPYLETRYEVVSDRADLYAYFYEPRAAAAEAGRAARLHLVEHLLQDRLGPTAARVPAARGDDRERGGLRRPPAFRGRHHLSRHRDDEARPRARRARAALLEGRRPAREQLQRRLGVRRRAVSAIGARAGVMGAGEPRPARVAGQD